MYVALIALSCGTAMKLTSGRGWWVYCSPLWNNPMLANLGHFHLCVLICSIYFNDVIFSSALLLPGPHKLTKREKIQMKLHNSSIIPIKPHTPPHVYCSGHRADVGGLPVSQQSRFTPTCSGLIPVWLEIARWDGWCNTLHVCHTYVCRVTGESHTVYEVAFWPWADRFLGLNWIFQAMSPTDMPPSSLLWT